MSLSQKHEDVAVTPLDRVDLKSQWSKPVCTILVLATEEAFAYHRRSRVSLSVQVAGTAKVRVAALSSHSFLPWCPVSNKVLHPGNRKVAGDPCCLASPSHHLACGQMCGACIPSSRVLGLGEVGTATGFRGRRCYTACSIRSCDRQAPAGVPCLHACCWYDLTQLWRTGRELGQEWHGSWSLSSTCASLTDREASDALREAPPAASRSLLLCRETVRGLEVQSGMEVACRHQRLLCALGVSFSFLFSGGEDFTPRSGG